jgi:hypothetical protein
MKAAITTLEKLLMISAFIEEYDNLMAELKYAFVTRLNLSHSAVQLDFMLDGENTVVLRLCEVVHLVLSQSLAEEGPHLVGELSITPVSDGGKEVLAALHYRFFKQNGEVFSYPGEQLFHFHLEGAICLEAVCRSYQLYRVFASG